MEKYAPTYTGTSASASFNGPVVIHKGVKGRWMEARNGGKWFRPLDWKPKVHLAAERLANDRDPQENIKTVCGASRKHRVTSTPNEVTCGLCANLMTIRRSKVLVVLIAALLWAAAQERTSSPPNPLTNND